VVDDKHAIRLSVLDEMRLRLRLSKRPWTMDELVDRLAVEALTAGEVREAVKGLELHGYVENLVPGRGVLLRLTAKGLDQVTKDAPLDEYIHGADAFRG
jgi:hypothetical protein